MDGEGIDEDSLFYDRVHSPVILIEFDHQRGLARGNEKPSRHHIHTVVRTKNANNYGKDLLRQYHRQFDHTRWVSGFRHWGQDLASDRRR